jgi:5,10-methylenetetrahydromethanopterin reductase
MSLGVLYNGLYDANEFIAFAREAEALGVEAAWIAEQPGHRDAFVIASAIAGQTGLKVYPGAISPYSRHPMSIAMSAAALNELAPGRSGVVLGTGGVPNQAAYGVRVEQAIDTMREAVVAVRGLLSGQAVETYGARFSFQGARLDPPAPGVPIFLAAIGPKLQAVAGEAADGVVFSSGHSPVFLAHSRKRVLAAHAASDRADKPFACAGFIVASVADDRATAYDRAKGLLSYLFSSPFKAEDWALNGVTVEHAAIRQALQRGDGEGAKRLVSDELAGLCSASGTPADFQARLRAYAAVGLDLPVLAPLGGPEEKRRAVRLALESL